VLLETSIPAVCTDQMELVGRMLEVDHSRVVGVVVVVVVVVVAAVQVLDCIAVQEPVVGIAAVEAAADQMEAAALAADQMEAAAAVADHRDFAADQRAEPVPFHNQQWLAAAAADHTCLHTNCSVEMKLPWHRVFS
jgi:hypothetical protein